MLVAILTILSALFLGVGFSAPALIIVPGFGELTSVLKLFVPEFGEPRTVSILGGILTLFRGGEFFLGALLLLFSVIFPLWKLGVVWATLQSQRYGEDSQEMLKFVDKLGKYSMLDVLVLALIVVTIKGLPGGTAVHIGWGMYAFAFGVLLSLIVPSLIREKTGSGLIST